MNGILFIIWLIIVIVVTLLIINYGGKLSSGIGMGLVIGFLTLLILQGIGNGDEKVVNTHATFLTFGFLLVITLIYLALYVIYRNAVELGRVRTTNV